MIFYAKREVLLMEMETLYFLKLSLLSYFILANKKQSIIAFSTLLNIIIGLQTDSINILPQHHEIFFDNNIITGWVTANIVFTII